MCVFLLLFGCFLLLAHLVLGLLQFIQVCPNPIPNEQKSSLRLLRIFFFLKGCFRAEPFVSEQSHFQRFSDFKDKFHESLIQANQLNGS